MAEPISISAQSPAEFEGMGVSRALARWRLLVVAVLFALTAWPALAADIPVARWWGSLTMPGDLRRLIIWSECFGHGLGVVLIGLIIYHLDTLGRWRLPRILVLALGAGLMADAVKLLVGRTRPRAFDLAEPVLQSFTGWLRFGEGGSNYQGFPSGHTATAVGLALALGWAYPRGRWLFAGFAVLVACQRMQSEAHFLSDTLGAAALGCLAGWLFLPGGACSGWLDRLESRWKRPVEP